MLTGATGAPGAVFDFLLMWEGQDRGRPNFKCAAPGAEQQQSMQEFFRRGTQLSMGEMNILDTPGKTSMRGTLVHALSVGATSSPHQGDRRKP